MLRGRDEDERRSNNGSCSIHTNNCSNNRNLMLIAIATMAHECTGAHAHMIDSRWGQTLLIELNKCTETARTGTLSIVVPFNQDTLNARVQCIQMASETASRNCFYLPNGNGKQQKSAEHVVIKLKSFSYSHTCIRMSALFYVPMAEAFFFLFSSNAWLW